MVISILVSIGMYFVLTIFIPITDFYLGLILSAIIPAVVSFPISYLIIKYTHKIAEQNKELIRLDFTTKKMFSVIAHDIRNPISTIKTVLNAYSDGHLSITDTGEYFKSLNQKTDQLILLIDDLLAWSDKQINQEELISETFHAGELIQPCLELYTPEIQEKQLTIHVNNTDTLITCEKGSYSFMIRNVIQNAVKFSFPNGIITIDVIQSQNSTTTTIQDTGKGISKTNLSKLLQTNEIFSTKGTKNENGSGIGIQTSQYFAQLNGGTIDIKSIEEKGTSVSITLPVKPVTL